MLLRNLYIDQGQVWDMDRTCALGSLACSSLVLRPLLPPRMDDSANILVRTDLIFQLNFWKYKAFG